MEDSLKVHECCENHSSKKTSYHLWIGPAGRVGDTVHLEGEEQPNENDCQGDYKSHRLVELGDGLQGQDHCQYCEEGVVW